ncbi:MAG: hypothetical protein ACPG3T_04070, partial [Pseudomonadales bacterium]
MVSQTNEQALESAIEKALVGSCLEERKNHVQEVVPDYGNKYYRPGNPIDFNMQYALDERFFWDFLEQTQEKDL